LFDPLDAGSELNRRSDLSGDARDDSGGVQASEDEDDEDLPRQRWTKSCWRRWTKELWSVVRDEWRSYWTSKSLVMADGEGEGGRQRSCSEGWRRRRL